MENTEVTDKKPFSINTTTRQFSARLTAADAAYFNENLLQLIPEESDPRAVTGADILMHLVSKTLEKVKIQKESQPSDLAKIHELETDLNSYKAIQTENAKNAEQLQKAIELLTDERDNYAALIGVKSKKIEDLQQQLEEKEGNVNDVLTKLEKETAPKPYRVVIDLTPGQFAVTEAFRAKLSEAIKRQITIPEMLFDLFWRYVKEQKTRIAFPFFYTPKQIQNIQDTANGLCD